MCIRDRPAIGNVEAEAAALILAGVLGILRQAPPKQLIERRRVRFSDLLLRDDDIGLRIILSPDQVGVQRTGSDHQDVGDATAKLSITTDDTIGVIKKANILDWTITLTRGARTTTLFGPGDDNSIVDIKGSALTATATQLSFDFGGADNSYVMFMNTDGSDISAFRSLWTMQTSGSFTSFRDPKDVIRFAFLPDGDPYIAEQARTGVMAFASIPGAVPEPASWAMMIAGLSLIHI